ncbi:helix-turn-helix domain-containing protein [Actinomyces provencensis]|uniref:helix-turn-helix domain-containing protein n=1 Tax=Actinomyces provencensis TaxID=1720198 RepID=UPI001177B158|nr:helix-turn-helix transcriptional regulator [Actinomyces provencensis]
MSSSQTAITREVRRWMTAERSTQAEVAARLGISQASLSRKLSGDRLWSIDDLDRLWDIGVPIDLPAYGEAAMAGADR